MELIFCLFFNKLTHGVWCSCCVEGGWSLHFGFLINSLMVSGVVVVSTEDGIDWASGAHAAVARDQHDQHHHHCA